MPGVSNIGAFMANFALPENIGQYKISRELGRGSMGTVYLGTQESLGREVAIKVLAPEFTREEEFLERFKREARTGGSLRHPNIVQVFDLGENDGYYYIAMEYMGPSNLKQMLTERGEKLPISEAVALTEQILSALEHAHSKGIVHRDVKPANILISEQGAAVLTDFSIAQMKSASRLTQTGAAVGTPEYMAPEQFDGKGVDGRADLYAVGIIFYQMLSGVQPFAGDTVAAVMKSQLFLDPPLLSTFTPSVSPELSEFVRKALQKNRDARFGSATEMLRELKKLSGRSVEGKGSSSTGRVHEAHSEHLPRVSLKENVPPSNVPPSTPSVASSPRFCPGCAKPVVPGHRHCANCGYEVGILVSSSGPAIPAAAAIVPQPQPKASEVSAPPAPASPFMRPGEPAWTVELAPPVPPTESSSRVVVPSGSARTAEEKPPVKLANAPRLEEEDGAEDSYSWPDILEVSRQIVGFASILMFLAAAAATTIHDPSKQNLRQILIFGSGVTLLMLTGVSLLLVGLEAVVVRRLARVAVSILVFSGLCIFCFILKSLLAA